MVLRLHQTRISTCVILITLAGKIKNAHTWFLRESSVFSSTSAFKEWIVGVNKEQSGDMKG